MALEDDPFGWQETDDGRIRVLRGGREVAVIAGRRAEGGEPESGRRRGCARNRPATPTVQHALARVIGNYRRSNERRPGRP